METAEEQIQKAQTAVASAESQFGTNDIGVSYELDKLAAVLKANGRLLEAANAAARARAIRTAEYSAESQQQDQKYGSASASHQPTSAVGWLKRLYRVALIGSAVLLIGVLIWPAQEGGASMAKGLIGSSLVAALIQLSLFPVELPRMMKWTIVAVGSGIAGMFLFK